MKRAMVLTVGTGTRVDANIVEPLLKSIGLSNPNFIGFLVSEVSRPNADKIASRLGFSQEHYKIQEIADPDDIEQVFHQSNSLIHFLLELGYSGDQITADYTSGTKSMTAGLVLAAVANRCGELKYITGKREQGIVQSGTERPVSIPPAGILAQREMDLARRLLRAYRFNSALDLLRAINQAILEPEDLVRLKALILLTEGYQAWDRFDHQLFLKLYDQAIQAVKPVKLTDIGLQDFVVPDSSIAALRNAIKSKRKGEIGPELLLDLLNNASRRIEEGKFDDATARLYRLVEMIGQWRLSKLGISTSDVDISKAPPEQKERLKEMRDHDGKIKIGLARNYDLLKSLGDEAGIAYMDNKKIQNLIGNRNNSILAHGIIPVEEKDCLNLRDAVHVFLDSFLPDYNSLLQTLKFPWTRSE